MNSTSKCPLKLFIQDIYRAEATGDKYVYQLFGQQFKNLTIHGVVTAVYNKNEKATNFELSDPTGSVQIYYDSAKSNTGIPESTYKDLCHGFEKSSRFGDVNIQIINKLMKCVSSSVEKPINFDDGDYLRVTGDIFVDDVRDIRMICAYQCMKSSVDNDIIWMEELNYVYEKYYLPKLEAKDQKS